MIYTARQLADLHSGNGQLVLPYGARLTPLAVDWAKSRKISIGYSNIELPKPTHQPIGLTSFIPSPDTPGEGRVGVTPKMLWWCDGPCGAGKAAIMTMQKESTLQPIDLPSDAGSLVKVVKHLAGEIKTGNAASGVILVQTGAAALLFANRCPSLRAVLGTCLQAVEQGISQVAANVLVIEYPYHSLMQIRNMLSRFVRGQRTPSEQVQKQLQELASCG
jgi:ribose 5-phosphate isomerase RpiB